MTLKYFSCGAIVKLCVVGSLDLTSDLVTSPCVTQDGNIHKSCGNDRGWGRAALRRGFLDTFEKQEGGGGGLIRYHPNFIRSPIVFLLCLNVCR